MPSIENTVMANRASISVVLVMALLSAASCGAGHKIEDGGERVDRAIERDIEHGKREVRDVFSDDAGTTRRGDGAPSP